MSRAELCHAVEYWLGQMYTAARTNDPDGADVAEHQYDAACAALAAHDQAASRAARLSRPRSLLGSVARKEGAHDRHPTARTG